MIESIAEKISKKQVKNPYIFIMVFILITLILAPGLLKLVDNVEPSLEKVLPQNVEAVQTMNDMRTQFGADMMYLVLYVDAPVSDVRNVQLLNYIDALSQKIRTHNSVMQIDSLADEVKMKNDGIIPESIYDIKSIDISNQYVNADYSLSVIKIKSDTGASAKTIKNLVEAIEDDIDSLEVMNPGSTIEITGFNAIDKATFEVIMSDFSYITFFSMLLVTIVVFITFKSLVKGMLPMVVVMTALIWTMGIVGYLGLTLTVVSMVSAAMIMGLGIDFGIHVVHTYFEKRKNMSSKKAHTQTLKELLRAMTGASLTTIAGFLSLLFGVLPAMKVLAIVLAVGIFNTLLGAVLLLPVIVYLYDKRYKKNEIN